MPQARSTGAPAVPIGIYLAPGANAVAVANAVSQKLEDLKPRFPAGVTYSYIYNTAEFVSAMIEKVLHTLVEAFVLVAIVVFLFLGRWRATLIPLLAVPVSVIGTFAVLLAVGYSANMISLLAMVLVIGLVVDDAIVVVENVERIMEENPELSPADATRKAMSEITGAVIAITLVLLSVFVPIAFLPGSSGVLFRQFAVTISAAMVISAIMALTLAPALCAVLLKPGHPTGIMKSISGFINATGNGFTAIVSRLVRVAVLSLAAVAGFAIASGYFMSRTPAGFLPAEDQGLMSSPSSRCRPAPRSTARKRPCRRRRTSSSRSTRRSTHHRHRRFRSSRRRTQLEHGRSVRAPQGLCRAHVATGHATTVARRA